MNSTAVLTTNLDDDVNSIQNAPFYQTIDKKLKTIKNVVPIYANLEQASAQVKDAAEGCDLGQIIKNNVGPGMNFPTLFQSEEPCGSHGTIASISTTSSAMSDRISRSATI